MIAPPCPVSQDVQFLTYPFSRSVAATIWCDWAIKIALGLQNIVILSHLPSCFISRYRTARLVTSLVKCTHCTLSSADYCTRMIARWCDTIILYRSKEVLGYAGVLNVDCENNQGSPGHVLMDSVQAPEQSFGLGLVVNPRTYTRHQQSRIGRV